MIDTIESTNENLILKYRYPLLSFCIIVLMILNTINGYHIGDFWEHSAVVHELAVNTSSPGHPQLSVNKPHAFFTPYALGVAMFAKILNNDAILALSIQGIFNLILFLFSLELFVTKITGKKAAAFYSLIFILLLWGDQPWTFSGFFHLTTLAYVLPYPSTFSAALMFFTLYLFMLYAEKNNLILLIPVFILSLIVLLTHPLTFIVLSAGLFILLLNRVGRIYLQLVILTALFLVIFLSASLWPYYPAYKLFFNETSVYHLNNKIMYSDVMMRIYPALLGLPLFIFRLKNNKTDFFFWMFILLTFVYAFGAFSGNWSYGRVISYIIIILQIVVADFIAGIEGNLRVKRVRQNKLKISFMLIVLLIIFPFSYGSLAAVISHSHKSIVNQYSKYSFIQNLIKPDDVILADLDTSWYLPTFGGKVVAAKKPLAFVSDAAMRRNDVNYFFYNNSSLEDRLYLVNKYKVDLILIDKTKYPQYTTIINYFQDFGKLIYENSDFVVIRLNR